MFVEPLECRRLMDGQYAAGLDPTFGDAGRLRFVRGFRFGYPTGPDLDDNNFHTVVSGNGNTFVAGTRIGHKFVVKIGRDGQIDPKFGNDGYATVPYAVTQLAYDAGTGLIYAGSTSFDYAAGRTADTLRLTRLRPGGGIDRAYGSDGTFSYTVTLPAGDGVRGSATLNTINPLPDGSVVLGVDRETTALGDDVYEQNLVLIKLRPKGVRDITYGKRGILQLLGGTLGKVETQITNSAQLFTVPARRGFFSDVRTDSGGQTHVLIRYGAGAATGSHEIIGSFSEMPDHGLIQVKSRTVSAAGVDDDSEAHSWTLSNDGHAGTSTLVRYAGPDGDATRVVLQKITGRDTDTQTGRVFSYTLRRGEKVVATPLTLPGLRVAGLLHVNRSADGHYVADDVLHIIRLRSNLSRDPTFTSKGRAVAADQFTNPDWAASIDGEGRVLANEDLDDGLERFA